MTIRVARPGRAMQSMSLDAFLRNVEATRVTRPSFVADRVNLVAEISRHILRAPLEGQAAGVVAFAYWTRLAGLKALAARCRSPRTLLRAKGLVMHLPPQNVQIMFLYSWVISYLLGNANVVRLPANLDPALRDLLDLYVDALAGADNAGQHFVHYPAQQDTNRQLSACSDARIVWGGDEKVRLFSDLPLLKGGKAIWFGSRRSLALVDGARLLALDGAERRLLAESLFRDVFTFDQAACSSPSRLFVVGTRSDHGEVTTKLLAELARLAVERDAAPPASHMLRKLTESYRSAAQGEVTEIVRYGAALTVAVVSSSPRSSTLPPPGGGYLELAYIPDLAALEPYLGRDTQTLSYFGFSQDEMMWFGYIATGSLKRIVKIGHALEFGAIWDGYDLCAELSDTIHVS